MNSDPEVAQLMVKWIEKYLGVSRLDVRPRLYIHRVYESENCEKYWSDLLGIPLEKFQKTIYKPTPHTVKRNQNYKGCLRLEVGKVRNFVTVMAWKRLLVESI
jgi:hypothetical protein